MLGAGNSVEIIMIEWANTNSGFLLVVLTSVYVFATVAILLVMTKSNQLSARSIKQTAELERSRLRPYVSMYLKVVKAGGNDDTQGLPYGYLFLKNSGISQAYNVSITMTPQIYSEPMMGGKKIKKIPFFIEHNIFNLAPSEELSDNLGFLSGIYEHFEKPVFRGKIRYFDANQTEYTEDFVLDFVSMSNATPYIERKHV